MSERERLAPIRARLRRWHPKLHFSVNIPLLAFLSLCLRNSPLLGQPHIRLPARVSEVVEEAAELDRRPVASLIRNVVEDWAEARRQREMATGPEAA